jgi:hypothetical protein
MCNFTKNVSKYIIITLIYSLNKTASGYCYFKLVFVLQDYIYIFIYVL